MLAPEVATFKPHHGNVQIYPHNANQIDFCHGTCSRPTSVNVNIYKDIYVSKYIICKYMYKGNRYAAFMQISLQARLSSLTINISFCKAIDENKSHFQHNNTKENRLQQVRSVCNITTAPIVVGTHIKSWQMLITSSIITLGKVIYHNTP